MKFSTPPNSYPFICDDDPEDFKKFAKRNAMQIRVGGAELAKTQRLYTMNFRRVRKDKKKAVDAHMRKWTGCKLCPLGQNVFCHSHVFFRGFVPADILFIGEAPGQSEDTIGLPFVGESGKTLNEIIESAAIEALAGGVADLLWAVTNSVLCYPMDAAGVTRVPSKKELNECQPRLLEFIDIVAPTVIITVGSVADKAVPRLSGISYHTIRHPSWILRKWDENERTLEKKRAALIVQHAIESLVPF